jgi:hypothetical protein
MITEKQISRISIWMIFPIGIIGSTLHFVYEWTGQNRWVSVFAAVNESYWEHIKIAIWPIFLLQLILFCLGGYRLLAFVPAMTVALYSVPISIVAIVFGYKEIVGHNILAADIATFFVAVAIAQVLFVRILRELEPGKITITISVFFLIALLVAFASFTNWPPAEPDLFIDPLNGGYGNVS